MTTGQSYILKGRNAFKEGLSIHDCPYPVGTRDRIQWRWGWNQENEKSNPDLAVIPRVSELNGRDRRRKKWVDIR